MPQQYVLTRDVYYLEFYSYETPQSFKKLRGAFTQPQNLGTSLHFTASKTTYISK